MDDITKEKDDVVRTTLSVGTDVSGNEITVDIPAGNTLDIDPEIIKKINDPEWISNNRERERKKNSERLNNYFKNTRFSGPKSDDFESRQLFDIPEAFTQLLFEVEDDDDDLDNRSRHMIKTARQASTLIEPSLLKGLTSSIGSMNYKNMTQVMDFLKFLKIENVDMSALDIPGLNEYFRIWKAQRRPSMPIIIQRLIQEADELFFEWLKTNKNLDAETKKILKTNVETRVSFLKDMSDQAGQLLYEMDDFIIQKFHLMEYGLLDDSEWFDRNKGVPGHINLTMGHYFDEFKARTGFEYKDVYDHFYKEAELELKKKEDEKKEPELKEMMGDDYIPSMVEGKSVDTQIVETEIPPIQPPNDNNHIEEQVIPSYDDLVYDEDDII